MGIEYHQGRPYFYRKVRRGGRVVSEYVCGGMLAAGMAELAEDGRAERAAADEAWRAERERMEAEERACVAYFDAVEARVREMLTAAGYHRPKRRWRKRRVRIDDAG